jgi:hypothetical protein
MLIFRFYLNVAETCHIFLVQLNWTLKGLNQRLPSHLGT